jgi:hypothetical protein
MGWGQAATRFRRRACEFPADPLGVWQIGLAGKKTAVPFSIRLSPEVYVGTLTLSRLGALRKKFQEKAK